MDKFTTKTLEETQQVGANMARHISAKGPQTTAVVLALHGDLGAGKTTFLQGFAAGLGINEVVNSPTFVIMKKFPIANSPFTMFYHLDLYRLEDEKDIEFLHLEEIISNPQNIVAIEWPEKISSILPGDVLRIELLCQGDSGREIIIGN